EPRVLSLELLELDLGRGALRLRPAPLGRERAKRPALAVAPPADQVRRVEALATQDRPNLAWGCLVRLGQDARLVFGRERPALRLVGDLRVGHDGREAVRPAARRRGRFATRGFASLAPLRGLVVPLPGHAVASLDVTLRGLHAYRPPKPVRLQGTAP